MSKQDALRRLSKEVPDPAEIRDILNALNKQPDPVAATVGASLLETAVERLLTIFLVEKSLFGRLFQDKGPLSDFNSKILMAASTGLISLEHFDELDRIRVIRNAFAHSRKHITFESEPVRRKLEDSSVISKLLQDLAKDLEGEKIEGNSLWFAMVKIAFVQLDESCRKLGGSPLALDDEPLASH